jgi:hypothetical protein
MHLRACCCELLLLLAACSCCCHNTRCACWQLQASLWPPAQVVQLHIFCITVIRCCCCCSAMLLLLLCWVTAAKC